MFEWLALAGPAMSAGAGVLSLFKKEKAPPGFNEAMAAAARVGQFSEALDPASAYNQRVTQQEEGRILSDFSQLLRQIMTQSRRAGARGMNTINPERRDETISRLAASKFEGAKDEARNRARQYILQQLQGAQAAASAYSPALMQTGVAMQSRAANRQAGGFEALGDLGGALGKILNGGQLPGNPRQTAGTSFLPSYLDPTSRSWVPQHGGI